MQKIIFGNGSVNKLKVVLEKHKPRKIFLVTGGKSYESCGARKIMEKMLDGFDFNRFSDFSLNPKIEDVERGAKVFEGSGADFVIAIGGGSVIDMAKLVNIFTANDGKPEDYVRKIRKIEKKPVPLVAIPTTSGTGSESTHFAVVYIGKTKYSLAHREYILPDYAIVDPELTMSMPKNVAADTGMDALCQALESYWCINSGSESKKYAAEAIKLAVRSLKRSVNHPDLSSRTDMSRASNLAGRAINITKTTAPHAVSYPITSHFGVPHGHAVGLTLPGILVYNCGVSGDDVLDSRGVEYVRKAMQDIISLLGCATPEEAKEMLTGLMNSVGLETRLGELGINKRGDMGIIISEGFNPDRVKNNPRRLTEGALRNILEEIA